MTLGMTWERCRQFSGWATAEVTPEQESTGHIRGALCSSVRLCHVGVSTYTVTGGLLLRPGFDAN